jgi:hypothetical protein
MFHDRANNFVLIIPDQLNHYMKDFFKESSHLIFGSKLTTCIMSFDGIVYNRLLFCNLFICLKSDLHVHDYVHTMLQYTKVAM